MADFHFHICSFSSLDDLRKKDRDDADKVLAVLARAGRFSTFEADGTLGSTIQGLLNRKLIRTTGGEYPWTTVELTDAGKKQLEATR